MAPDNRRNADQTTGTEHHFEALLEAMPVAVYTTDPTGRLTFYNQAAAELWGHRPTLGDTSWCGSWRLYWSDGTPLPHDQCPMAIALREQRPVRGMEAIAERPDGTRVPFIPFPTPLHDASGTLIGAINTLVDVSERQQSALMLRERDEHYRHIVELNPHVLWIANANGQVVDIGQRWVMRTGLDSRFALGDGWLSICHPDDLAGLRRAVRRSVATGQSFSVEHRIRTAEGDYLWVHSRASPRRNTHGQIIFWYGSTEDIDARVRAELRRNQLEIELRHAMRVNAIGQVVGTLAHEVSQPLASAVNYLDGCDTMLIGIDAGSTMKVRHALEQARGQIEHAAAIVTRLRQFIRKQAPAEQPADLNQIVSDAVELATASSSRRLGICIDLDLDATAPVISADPVEMQQVVLNLVRNAIEALEFEETRELRVVTRVADGAATISVSDTGPGLGVRPEDIFEPFLTTKPAGLGLGLPICRRIVERYGGKIWAEANDKLGATLCGSLPVIGHKHPPCVERNSCP